MVLGPAGMPKDLVHKLEAQVARAVNSPDVQEKLKATGMTVINGGSEESEAFLKSEYRKWAERIKASGTILE
jgi:tripartite-type tricarboxylate transporter receptor subunit TctC